MPRQPGWEWLQPWTVAETTESRVKVRQRVVGATVAQADRGRETENADRTAGRWFDSITAQ